MSFPVLAFWDIMTSWKWSLPYHLLQCPIQWLHKVVRMLMKIKVTQNVTLATFQGLSSHMGLAAAVRGTSIETVSEDLGAEQTKGPSGGEVPE